MVKLVFFVVVDVALSLSTSLPPPMYSIGFSVHSTTLYAYLVFLFHFTSTILLWIAWSNLHKQKAKEIPFTLIHISSSLCWFNFVYWLLSFDYTLLVRYRYGWYWLAVHQYDSKRTYQYYETEANMGKRIIEFHFENFICVVGCLEEFLFFFFLLSATNFMHTNASGQDKITR